MKIPDDIVAKYKVTDYDTAVFLRVFDEVPGRLIEVGAHDEPVANMLTECGFDVTGVDLREYNPDQDMGDKREVEHKCNYKYIRSDFCNLPKEYLFDNYGKFDCVVSLSAIEHFGLNTYGEGPYHTQYDIIAMRTIWHLLKDGGAAYITVPYGKSYAEVVPHYRVYDHRSIVYRLASDFDVVTGMVFVADKVEINGRTIKPLDYISLEEANSYDEKLAHLSVLIKMIKKPVVRIAKDGR